ncbi:MAG: hypothetical protein EU530_05110 [Promethearchaeota archaeon]|nr:MAG: hypothetical protein EU530_05110 [Candidatus Lokiarchaeota archaeon]
MGLDRFMGTDSEKPKKKTSEKKSGKKTSTHKSKEQDIEKQPQIKDVAVVSLPDKKSVSDMEKPPTFSFITMNFKCTNPKCKMKKSLRKPQSFTPSEKELICPKCGSPLKKSRAK